MRLAPHHFLPGLLVAATGVGAGDLVTASLAGSALGTSLIWAAVAGALLKYALNEGLVRWQLATGTTLLEGWAAQLGRGVLALFGIYLVLWGFVVGGALIAACGVAAQSLLPLGEETTGRVIWGVVHSLLGLALVKRGGFRLFERAMTLCIVVMVAATAYAALQAAPPAAEVARGLIPSLPADGLPWLAGVLGGVGGTVTLLSYGYWIREHAREGEDGLRICRADLALGYLVTGLFGVAMIVLGARTQLDGSGARVALELAAQLQTALGEGGRLLFLVGFWGAVFSSLLGVWQGVPYLAADTWRLLRGEPRSSGSLTERPAYRRSQWALALVPLAFLGLPVEQITQAYAVLGALFMPFLAATLLFLNSRLAPGWRNGPLARGALWLTLLVFAGLGARAFGLW